MKSRKHKDFLIQELEVLQARGQYWFSQKEMISKTGSTPQAFAKAVNRLAHKGKVCLLSKGFFLIVPVEYKENKILPPTWFIDHFMKYLDREYYVGLLSAAFLYGAAHQKPQEFQVITKQKMRDIIHSRLKIRFFCKKTLQDTPLDKIKTTTGFIKVSTPEATAFDLIQYMGVSGSLGNVATVLVELSDKMSSENLLKTAQQGKYSLPTIQRLGYILYSLGKETLLEALLTWVQAKRPRYVWLRPELEKKSIEYSKDWRVISNDIVEVDV